MSSELASVKAPILLIWVEKDVVVSLALGGQLAQLISHFQSVVLKGTGHNVSERIQLVTDFPEEE